MKDNMNETVLEEVAEVGLTQFTVKRLYNGFLEVRYDIVKRAKDMHKGLRLVVKAERKDCQTISLQDLINHPATMIIKKEKTSKYKEDYVLYRWIWAPDQEVGQVLTRIHKKKDGNKRGKQNRSKL